MAKCSSEYLSLIVTRSGLTPKQPSSEIFGIDIPPTLSDYEEWKELAQSLAKDQRSHLLKLGDIETEKGVFTKWNQFVDESNRVQAESQELDAVFFEFFKELSEGEITLEGPIEDAIRVSTDAVCLMEQIDEAIVSYGRKAPGIAPPPPGKKSPGAKLGFLGTVGILAITGVVIGGIYYYSRTPALAAGE